MHNSARAVSAREYCSLPFNPSSASSPTKPLLESLRASVASGGAPFLAPYTPYTPQECQSIQERLNEKLARDRVSYRQGPGNSRIAYVQGWQVIELANHAFGFNGWSSNVISTTVDFIDTNPNGKVTVGISAIMRVTLKDGTYREDIGYGQGDSSRKGDALEKARKAAMTDALKRTLRSFGNLLGNCLYDKHHLRELELTRNAPNRPNSVHPVHPPASSSQHCSRPPPMQSTQPPRPVTNLTSQRHGAAVTSGSSQASTSVMVRVNNGTSHRNANFVQNCHIVNNGQRVSTFPHSAKPMALVKPEFEEVTSEFDAEYEAELAAFDEIPDEELYKI